MSTLVNSWNEQVWIFQNITRTNYFYKQKRMFIPAQYSALKAMGSHWKFCTSVTMKR